MLVLDEPTASLTERETERLFSLIEQAKREGVGIVYITHRVSEIKRIGDRVTVLRDGRKIATLNAAETSEMRLVELMTGRVVAQIFPKINYRPGASFLEVRNLSTSAGNVSNVSIRVRGGEIVGLAGLIGSGKSELARACFGVRTDRRRRRRFRRRGGHSPNSAPDAGPRLLLSAAGPAR